MNKYIFTYGGGQRFAPHHTIIEANDVWDAKEEMHRVCGVKWSMCYDYSERLTKEFEHMLNIPFKPWSEIKEEVKNKPYRNK